MISYRFRKYLMLVVSALVVFTGCRHQEKTDAKEAQTASIPDTLQVIKVQTSNPEKELHLPAELLPFNEVSIFPKVNGYVKNVNVDRGSKVSKGQLLVDIEAPEIDAQLSETYARKLSAEAVYKASKLNYRRVMETNTTPGAVSANDIDQVRSKMLSDSALAASADAGYIAQKEMKKYLRIEAPFAGIISERNISPGSLAGSSAKNKDVPMLVLKDEGKLRLTVAIPEAYTGEVMQKKQVDFTVKAYPGRMFSAILARRSGSLTTAIRSEMVEFDVINSDNLLESGMYAEVALHFERSQPGIYVPKTSIVSSTERIFVIKVVNGMAQKTDVQTGNNLGSETEIFGDVKKGDLLVLKASDEIRDGKKLVVKN